MERAKSKKKIVQLVDRTGDGLYALTADGKIWRFNSGRWLEFPTKTFVTREEQVTNAKR
jgi:alpha-tubulin suppressor-like RCC1 family protein